jgi:hypothetical protein
MKAKTKKSKAAHAPEDYIVLGLPENPTIFGVERVARPEEKFVLAETAGFRPKTKYRCGALSGDKSPIGEYYESVMHIVSPFINFYTGEPTESCSCLSWRTRQKRCIHLRTFYKLNPHLDKGPPKEKPKEETKAKSC